MYEREVPSPGNLLTLRQAAARMTVSPITVRRMIDDGELHPFRVGKRVRVDRREVEEVMQNNPPSDTDAVARFEASVRAFVATAPRLTPETRARVWTLIRPVFEDDDDLRLTIKRVNPAPARETP